MKSIEEIENMLVEELCASADNVECMDKSKRYFNDCVGDASFILAALLHQHLKLSKFDWCKKKWIDDCLLSKIQKNENEVCIWGVMIWGREGVNSQWVEPFFFKIDLDCNGGQSDYIIMFGSADHPELKYEDFLQNREYWDVDYYVDENWDPYVKSWRYVIESVRLREM